MSDTVTRAECSQHVTSMTKQINDLGEKLGGKIDKLTVQVAEFPDKFFERADKRYASKLSEKVVYSMVGIVLTIVFGALVYSVLK